MRGPARCFYGAGSIYEVQVAVKRRQPRGVRVARRAWRARRVAEVVADAEETLSPAVRAGSRSGTPDAHSHVIHWQVR